MTTQRRVQLQKQSKPSKPQDIDTRTPSGKRLPY